jgi:hypothetical protein
MGVQFRRDALAEEGYEHIPQVRAPSHPLVVVPAVVVVGTVKLAPRERLFDPVEQGLMLDVHPEGDLGLAPITAEMPLTHEQPYQDPQVVVAGHVAPPVVSP